MTEATKRESEPEAWRVECAMSALKMSSLFMVPCTLEWESARALGMELERCRALVSQMEREVGEMEQTTAEDGLRTAGAKHGERA